MVMRNRAFHVDTIVAPSTPPGHSGLAVIRLSGPTAIELVDRLFKPAGKMPSLATMPGYTVTRGDFDGIDEVLITLFRTPRSFTGEDVVEISCHGGPAVKRAILRRLLASGASLAEAGEFSRRAFINGKLDLVQAEAIMDLIGAEAERQVGAAYRQLKGELSEQVKRVSTLLYTQMAAVELILEFPEHEAHDAAFKALASGIKEVLCALTRLTETYERGRLIQEGARVVIHGEPNVGKSSLLNAFVGKDRAIVTSVPGTTRDTIEFWTEIDGFKVILVDTAGVRETIDPVEKEGVKRSVEALQDADIILFLLTEEPTDSDFQSILRQVDLGKGVIVLFGKDDLRDTADSRRVIESFKNRVEVKDRAISVLAYSAKRHADQERLAEAISAWLETGNEGRSTLLLTSARHKQILDLAIDDLNEALGDVERGVTLDLVAVRLRVVAERLSQLTGEDVSETLVDTIFSSFCVGK